MEPLQRQESFSEWQEQTEISVVSLPHLLQPFIPTVLPHFLHHAAGSAREDSNNTEIEFIYTCECPPFSHLASSPALTFSGLSTGIAVTKTKWGVTRRLGELTD